MKYYSNDEVWEKEYKELQEEAPKLKEFEGKLGDGETLIKYFEVNEKYQEKQKKFMFMHI